MVSQRSRRGRHATCALSRLTQGGSSLEAVAAVRKVARGRLDSRLSVIGCAPREGSRPAFVRPESCPRIEGDAKATP
jgi:hypothetical protein